MADKVVDAVKSGAIKRFVVMVGCDGCQKTREYYTEVAENLPKDTVILTAGCAKYRYNKLALGDIGGIPRVLDAGQCNDSYSLAVIALKLKEIFELEDINDLPVTTSPGTSKRPWRSFSRSCSWASRASASAQRCLDSCLRTWPRSSSRSST